MQAPFIWVCFFFRFFFLLIWLFLGGWTAIRNEANGLGEAE